MTGGNSIIPSISLKEEPAGSEEHKIEEKRIEEALKIEEMGWSAGPGPNFLASTCDLVSSFLPTLVIDKSLFSV